MPDCLQGLIIVTVHLTIAIKFDFTLFCKRLKQRAWVGDSGKLTAAAMREILGMTGVHRYKLAQAA